MADEGVAAPAEGSEFVAQGVPEQYVRASREETHAALADAFVNHAAKAQGVDTSDLSAMAKLVTSTQSAASKPAAPAPGGFGSRIDIGAAGPANSFDDIVERAGLKMDDLHAEYAKNGDISKAQYDAFAKNANMGPGLVKQQIEGIKQKNEAAATRCQQAAGGADKFKNLLAYADSTLDAETKGKLDKLLNDPDTAEMATHDLLRRQREALGAEGSKPMIDPASPAAANGAADDDKFSLDDPAKIASLTGHEKYSEFISGTNIRNPKFDVQFRREADRRLAESTKKYHPDLLEKAKAPAGMGVI